MHLQGLLSIAAIKIKFFLKNLLIFSEYFDYSVEFLQICDTIYTVNQNKNNNFLYMKG